MSENVESRNALMQVNDPPPAETTTSKNFSVFNQKYNIVENLGDGNTSRVYLGQALNDPTEKVAIKIFK